MKHFIKKTMMAIAAIVMCISFAATNVTAVNPGAKSDYNENKKSEIVFVWNGFAECYVGNTDNPPESYKGYFIERNGNIRTFSFKDVNEHWTFGYVSMEDIPKTISLNKTEPQEKLLSQLADVSKYQIVGKVSEEELDHYLNLLSDVDTNTDIKMDISPLDIVQGYSETFGLRYDDNGNAEVVFLNGIGTIINKHTDEKALEIDSWLRNLDSSYDNTNTEIVFCIVKTKQTGKTSYSYAGYFIESNGNVRHFSFEDIEDEWTLIFGEDYFNTDGTIKLDAAMPHEKLLSILSGNISAYKIIGNISEEEYASKASLLSKVDTNAEVTFKGFEYVGFPTYNESFGVRYDNDDNAQIVFMNGHVNGDMKYRTYLENPDEKAIELNKWLIEKCMSFVSPEPITTTAPVTTDVTTATTVTTTTVPAATPEKGDANGDGKIDIRDAAFIAILCAKGQYEDIPEWADYNGDGKRNIRDAAFLAIDLAKGKIKA